MPETPSPEPRSSHPATPPLIRGSCLCGAVAFEVRGELTPIQLCHATRCRKATGGAFAPELLVADADLHWLKGREAVRVYEAPLLEEPPAYRRAFCAHCGSPLPQAIEGTGFTGLLAGVLDDDPGTRPFRHAFTDHQAAWLDTVDALPRFGGRPPRPGG